MLHLYAAEIQASKIIPRKYISNIWIVGDVAAPNGLIFWEKTLVIAHYKWIEVWHWESEAQSIFYVSQAWSVWTLTSESWKNWDIVFWYCACYIKPIPSSLLKWMLLFVGSHLPAPSVGSSLYHFLWLWCTWHQGGGRDEAIRNTMRLIDIRFSHHLQLILEAEIQPGTRSEQ